MRSNTIMLIVVLLVIVGVIWSLNSLKAGPSLELSGNQVNPLADVVKGSIEEQRILKKQDSYDISPELIGIKGYINTDYINISSLRGDVVLVDFWTYSCINCIRTTPYLVSWDKKYRDKGLVIIGVHTPEFNFEKEYSNVRDAVERNEIEYPVVLDNDYGTWRAFGNRYWPRKYLIDQDGFIRYDHIGEGGYEETEKMIQMLLSERGETVYAELTPETQSGRISTTPELYLGYEFALPRDQNLGNDGGLQSGVVYDYSLPSELDAEKIYLEGEWRSNTDSVESVADSRIILIFKAAEVNIVAEPSDAPVEVEVFLNGEPITDTQAGKDVLVEDDRSYFVVDGARLYNVYKNGHSEYELDLRSEQPYRVNAYTFG